MNTSSAQQITTAIGTDQAAVKVGELSVTREGSSNPPWVIDLQQYDFVTAPEQQQLTITAQQNKGDLRFWQMHEEIGLECTLKTDTQIRRFKAQMDMACERDLPAGRYQSAKFSIIGPIEERLDFTP